jgi:hypothetical protein
MRCRGVIWFKPTSFDLTMLRIPRGEAFHGRTAEIFCGAGESDPARAVAGQAAHWNRLRDCARAGMAGSKRGRSRCRRDDFDGDDRPVEVTCGLHRRAAGGGEFWDIFWRAGGGVLDGALGRDPRPARPQRVNRDLGVGRERLS